MLLQRGFNKSNMCLSKHHSGVLKKYQDSLLGKVILRETGSASVGNESAFKYRFLGQLQPSFHTDYWAETFSSDCFGCKKHFHKSLSSVEHLPANLPCRYKILPPGYTQLLVRAAAMDKSRRLFRRVVCKSQWERCVCWVISGLLVVVCYLGTDVEFLCCVEVCGQRESDI